MFYRAQQLALRTALRQKASAAAAAPSLKQSHITTTTRAQEEDMNSKVVDAFQSDSIITDKESSAQQEIKSSTRRQSHASSMSCSRIASRDATKQVLHILMRLRQSYFHMCRF